ncbi:DUF2259 domain-containing protein [Aquamicrobium zhengzhouense]|uniref:DUF2259 domain-containing protein n=1 Tax=Aquamicrobium zhengzhouense TaxID=2781738 RepID=A0ABS0S860_9HYPH|nr:DUF2259 domain-containing protein [Aquamicrobium zhengzhouense]MBI1619484.1 DUF2259 domain-containing protein [Aquamicrobium zhengzhouense]
MKPVTYIAPALLALALSPLAALAGDVAELNILGFSADGKVFAFEEYGVQDGSGFPYANRYYIDVETDRSVPGSPVRIRIDDESASVADAREKARHLGAKIYDEDELASNRGTLVASNPVTERSADPHRVALNPRPVFPPIDPLLEFRIEEIFVEQPKRCEGLVETKGFKLIRIGVEPGKETRVLHEDEAIPDSRGCPTGYRIGGVQTFFPDDAEPVYAILIAVETLGFEGPDFRWIAIPGRL